MDACCLCRPFDDRTQDRIRIETEAVLTILGRCNEDWILVGSEAIDFELSAVMDQKKRTDAFVLASLAKEKIKTDKRIIKSASELEKLGFKTMDAAHISCAERAADIMFTVDDDVQRVARIKRNQISIEIENPLRWLINVFQD
ncbi:MAG: PIN domain-containing protein [Methanothrix sp.]